MVYSLQIFGYNCSIVIIFYFPCISLFYSFVCSSHLCILSYMHVPYGAFFINKEFEFINKCWVLTNTFFVVVYFCNLGLVFTDVIGCSFLFLIHDVLFIMVIWFILWTTVLVLKTYKGIFLYYLWIITDIVT